MYTSYPSNLMYFYTGPSGPTAYFDPSKAPSVSAEGQGALCGQGVPGLITVTKVNGQADFTLADVLRNPYFESMLEVYFVYFNINPKIAIGNRTYAWDTYHSMTCDLAG